MTRRTAKPRIRFDATLYAIEKSTVPRLPERASKKLPSRGQVAARGRMNGREFETVLEPDGRSGHWMRIGGELQSGVAISAGHRVTLEIEATTDWPEPKVPRDFAAALSAAPQEIRDLWKDITPMARWEWVRGKRRPCSFNLAACTDPQLASHGRLREDA